MAKDVKRIVEDSAAAGVRKIQKNAEDVRAVIEDIHSDQIEAIADVKTRVGELYEEDNRVSKRKLPTALRVFGILAVVVSLFTIPVDVFSILVLSQAIRDTDFAAMYEITVSTQALILYAVNAFVDLVQTVLFMVLGIRLARNKRRGAARLSQTLIGVAVASMVIEMMTEGLGWNVAYAFGVLIFLIVMYTVLDPTLREERILQRKLKALEDKADQEEGMLGRDKTGEGYLKLDFFNIFWLFVIASVIGLIFESAVCPFLNNRIENRTGMLWGPFSPIYGIGAVLMVIPLNKFYDKDPFIIFFISALIGGAFEFSVSWFFQFAFGISSWDYSTEPFNIDGRTDLFHMVCWGALGLIFIKFVVPKVLELINRIPWNWRYAVTTICATFMIVNAGMTLMSFECWYSRMAGVPIDTPVAEFFDEHYDDEFMHHHFATMSIDPERATRS